MMFLFYYSLICKISNNSFKKCKLCNIILQFYKKFFSLLFMIVKVDCIIIA